MSTRARPASNSSESRREAAPGGDVDRSGARSGVGAVHGGFPLLMFAVWLMFGILGKSHQHRVRSRGTAVLGSSPSRGPQRLLWRLSRPA